MSIRKIVLDTETTGLRISEGHRIIEIGCCELIDFKLGKSLQLYINPERAVSPTAFGVHGISDAFLQDKPKFREVADQFLQFIGDDQLIIHNAGFDMGFLNHELGLLKMPLIDNNRAIDTLRMARKKYPGSPASLDALCSRFSISTSERSKHGALLDAHLLALVYIAMHDASQVEMNFAIEHKMRKAIPAQYLEKGEREFAPTQEEIDNHNKLLLSLKNPIWAQYCTQD